MNEKLEDCFGNHTSCCRSLSAILVLENSQHATNTHHIGAGKLGPGDPQIKRGRYT